MEEDNEVIGTELPTNNKIFIDETVLIVDSKIPPILSEEEADEREYEKIEETDEGGL